MLLLPRGGGRARRFVFVPPNLDSFMTVHKVVGHELDWLRQRFIFVSPNLRGGSNLFTALLLYVVLLCVWFELLHVCVH